jgi:hypothetical protein
MMDNPLSVWGPAGFIVTMLAGAVTYLYKELRKESNARIEDHRHFEEKSGALFDEYRKQQDLWFEKIQIAKGKR